MCGIAGFLNFDFRYPYFGGVNSIQAHRGPDHQDHWQNDSIALYHQRLSIIDLSERANQPFEKGNLVIVYNGEIYNYKELRNQLQNTNNVEFHTTSDTEVVLELFRLKGPSAVNDLRGMFAFSIYDTDSESLFIARDHFGIKPLFYFQKGKSFGFASELKTLIDCPGFEKDLNRQSLLGAMSLLWVPGYDSMFEGCYKLPAAHYMTVDAAGKVDLQQYWELNTSVRSMSEQQWIDKIDECFSESVKFHLESDVPVSSFLSGGLDSSLITKLAFSENPVSTYTIKTSLSDRKVEKMPDDSKFARKMALSLGSEHHEIEIDPDITRELPFIVGHLDEPIGDPAAINTYLISKAAHDHGCKVLLSGMGADEIFFGYRRQKATLLASNYQRLPWGIRKGIRSASEALPVKVGSSGFKMARWGKRFLSFADKPLPDAYLRSYSYYDDGELEQLFADNISEEITGYHKYQNQFFDTYLGDPINQMCNTDINMFMQGLNLTYTDRASMAASVEVRVPFIDREVVQLAMSIPGKLKFRNGESKYLLKKMAERYLPKEIVYRPKAAFGAPIRSWIGSDLKEMVGDLLSEDSIKRRGVFDSGFVRKLIESDRKGEVDNAYQIYQLLTVELWFRRYCDGK
jgi:asparagine synthase (glutamine-hydrolysing)